MTVTPFTVAKGAGALTIKQISSGRLLYLNFNSKYTFNKATSDGDKVQGFNSDGKLVDLDVSGQDETYELEVSSKKHGRNINELVLGSEYVTKASFNAPWSETGTVASGTVTLNGGSPVAASLQATYIDGTKLTSTGTTPSAAGTYKDNGDGTVTFHAGDNGKTIVFFYYTTVSNVFSQGGADQTALGYLEVAFHQVVGSSSVSNKKAVDILWLPKCTLAGESALEFDNNVQDKTFKFTALIPDTPAGFKVPYQITRYAEINNTNAG